jgi:hypothetical protein
MAASFDREQLLAALDEVGRAAIDAKARLFASPAEFRSRNIFTEERPLRRARTHAA